MDVNTTGLYFTWNQKPKGSNDILKKIDRIMCNIPFTNDFSGSFAIFQPYRISDHSPCVLRIPKVSRPKHKPFKFSNFLVYKEGFRDVVESGWSLNVTGCAMYRVVKRLNGLKTPFRKLLHDQGNLHDWVNRLRVELDEAQKVIDRNPSCLLLRDEHARYLMAFKEASLEEERFLRQKSKIEWLNAGESNTAYFYKIVKSKCARNRIEMVRDSSNIFKKVNERTPDALEEFKNVLRLVPSIPKSNALFCNVPNALKANILSSMPFAEGTLPVRYLGVLLISSRLLYHDCKVLIEKLESCVNDWEMKKGRAKVAWEVVCLPQREGGLGIRRIEDFNIALMATHIWCILINKESLWVQWIHSYKLQDRSFWDVPCLVDFDKWDDPCSLRDMLTVRNIVRSDFSLSETVSDLISNGSWRWPHDWSSRFLNVVNIHVPEINNDLDDEFVWRDVRGVFQRFSVARAWNSLRLRVDVVDWYHFIWFPHCIPRHAIHMWLVIKEKFKTQDRLRQWDVGPSIYLNLLKCPLCDMVPDSHSHLFFEWLFAYQVWFQVLALNGMSSVPPRFVDVLAFLIPSKGSSVSNVISWIVLAATTYCLWNEQNSRLFKKKKLNADQIVQHITSLVRMKLVTFKFKRITAGSRLLLDQ
ncbi:putative gag-pol polyprotein [Tanacetum coccineum]